MVYNDLLKEAKKVYDDVAKNSPFVAQFEARKVIASKIDLCTDRNEHLDVLEWKEYKENYAPMTKKEYESKMKTAKENYEATVLRIEKEYKEKGVNSPDYHKV